MAKRYFITASRLPALGGGEEKADGVWTDPVKRERISLYNTAK